MITQKSFKRNGSPELLVHHSAFLAPLALDSNPLGEQALVELIPNAPDCGGRDAIHPRHPEVNAQSTSTFRRKIKRLNTLVARRTWPTIALAVLASLAGNGLCAAIPEEAKDGLPAIASAAMEAAPRTVVSEPITGEVAFARADARPWRQIFFDAGTGWWNERWFLDGEIGSVTNGPKGMTLTAGPEAGDDAHHVVLWTKEAFTGDLKIEFEYARLDHAAQFVNILYIQATGSGVGRFVSDIKAWRDLRRVPAMRTYFDHMHTYHLSFATFPDAENSRSYIRGRRYLPHQAGLNGTELEPDCFPVGLFETGVSHQITVIKTDRDLFIRVANSDQTYYCHLINAGLPIITEGRIGLRHMFTRSARYANFRVSVP